MWLSFKGEVPWWGLLPVTLQHRKHLPSLDWKIFLCRCSHLSSSPPSPGRKQVHSTETVSSLCFISFVKAQPLICLVTNHRGSDALLLKKLKASNEAFWIQHHCQFLYSKTRENVFHTIQTVKDSRGLKVLLERSVRKARQQRKHNPFKIKHLNNKEFILSRIFTFNVMQKR